MTLAIVYSRAVSGITAPLVTVEVHLSPGAPGLHMVGLAEAAVKESKDRVRSALMTSNFEPPIRYTTINLAPADLPKEGGRFDLPIALGILAASRQIPMQALEGYEFSGELALSGELRPIKGVLPMVMAAMQANRALIVPAQNANEAALVQGAKVYYAEHLLQVCAHLLGKIKLPSCALTKPLQKKVAPLDLADVKGQPHAKRALEIAAAGQHSLMFVGPPGTGKTMLANRLTSILPPISDEEALEVATILSVSSAGFDPVYWGEIPLRSPHHSSSTAALVGGGRPPRPGEISLAHRGVLLLDELPEFGRHVLESLREPLESGAITISRAAFQAVFPALFQFIATMNPCPCGYAGSGIDRCQCSPLQINRYLGKISGPLLDRIDMQVEVARLAPEQLAASQTLQTEKSATVRGRVVQSREKQYQRQRKYNAALSVPELEIHAKLNPGAKELLHQAMIKFNLSARVYHRVTKLARTIADLVDHSFINESHISEALSYRCLDRNKTMT